MTLLRLQINRVWLSAAAILLVMLALGTASAQTGAGAEEELAKLLKGTPPQNDDSAAEVMAGQALAKVKSGDYGGAETLLKSALARQKDSGPSAVGARARCLTMLAELYRIQGALALALPLARRANNLLPAAALPEDLDLVSLQTRLAQVFQAAGEEVLATDLWLAALTVLKKLAPGGASFRAEVLEQLARAKVRNREISKAADYYQQLAAVVNIRFVSTRGITLTIELAQFHQLKGDPAESRRLLEQALADVQLAQGSDSPMQLPIVQALAELYEACGESQKAEVQLQLQLQLVEKLKSSTGLQRAAVARQLATFYRTAGQLVKTERFVRRALFLTERELGPEHPQVAKLLDELAQCQGDLGQAERAEPLLLRALDIRRRVLGPRHPQTRAALIGLSDFLARQGALYSASGTPAKAAPYYARALAARQAAEAAAPLPVR